MADLDEYLHGADENGREGLDSVEASDENLSMSGVRELLLAVVDVLGESTQPGGDVLDELREVVNALDDLSYLRVVEHLQKVVFNSYRRIECAQKNFLLFFAIETNSPLYLDFHFMQFISEKISRSCSRSRAANCVPKYTKQVKTLLQKRNWDDKIKYRFIKNDEQRKNN